MRVLVVVVALVLVGGVAGGIWFLFAREDPETAATLAADRFTAAWTAGDWGALERATTTASAADAHAALAESLSPSSVTVGLSRIELEDVGDGIASASYEARYEFEGLGAWGYAGAFDVVEVGDEWLVDWQPAVLHPEYEEGFSFRLTRIWPERAPIRGQGGVDLAGEGDVVIVGIEPRRVDDHDDVVEAIDDLTPASGSEAAAILDRDDLRDDWFYPVVTMSRSAYNEVRDDLRPVPGLVFQEDTDRTGASPATEELIGYVEEITAEQLEELGEPYSEGDRVGRTGLEASLERRLAGEPGGEITLVDDDGAVVAVLEEFPPAEPEPVELTIDPAVQDAAAGALADVDAGGVVAIDVATGAVRAAVSRPADGFPRAFTGQYPPGSTFKVVTAAALLEHGLEPGDTVACPAEVRAGGRDFRNAGDAELGAVSFREAFAESCNTAFVEAASTLPEGALAAMAERFGFGAGDDGAYGVAGRRVPAAFPAPADDAEVAAAAIGQGRVLASPLQMASVAATAAGGGRHPPYLLAEEAGAEVEALPDGISETLRALMREVVTTGTGTAADVGSVIGKTGTAEHDGGDDHAWFIGEAGGLAFAVLVEGGGAGGETAAPVAASFVDELGF